MATNDLLIRMKQNDTPSREFTAKREDGSIIDLTNTIVRFKIYDTESKRQTNYETDECSLTIPLEGKCVYQFKVGDVPDAVNYQCELEITFDGGNVETSPYDITINAGQEITIS